MEAVGSPFSILLIVARESPARSAIISTVTLCLRRASLMSFPSLRKTLITGIVKRKLNPNLT